ncbi:MAG TPA: DUF2232 domain-containing protein [Gemmatimonadota bacterium]|nr:DUF2232 domain-containing protein [Gemmatimonadota bacterium]
MSPRGWSLVRALALAGAVLALSPVSPLVLVLVPLAVYLLAFRRQSPWAVALAIFVLAAAFQGLVTGMQGPMWYVERAWALLLGGAFALATVGRRERGLVTRGMTALAGALAVVGIAAIFRSGLLSELDWRMGQQLGRAASAASTWLSGDRGPMARELGSAIYRVFDWEVRLYPGFLALASLAALGVGSYVGARLSGRDEALGPVRDFRFSDHLVWLVVGGLVLFLAPLGDVAARVGENLLVLMSGLYLLRGAGVLLWVVGGAITSGWMALLWAAVAVLLYPVAFVAALVLGLGDTWLDLRRRLAAPPGPR